MRHRNAGVTLIELMTVMMVLAILTSIALPSYRNYVIRANRTDAKTSAMAMAGALERCFTRFNAYNNAGCTVDITDFPSGEGHYLLNAAVTATTFTVSAVPQAKQASDTGCGTFRLNQINQRTVTGSKPATECWGR